MDWNWFYSFIFPSWIPPLAPTFGLAYGLIGYIIYRSAKYLSGNPVINFYVLGGVEGLLTHLWVIYGNGVIAKVPMLKGVSPTSILIFATFEKAFYWGIILLMALMFYIIWKKLIDAVLELKKSTSN